MARIAYYASDGFAHLMPDGNLGFTVAIVEENSVGYWAHRQVFATLEEAKAFADEQNAIYGYTSEDVLAIVASSMNVGMDR